MSRAQFARAMSWREIALLRTFAWTGFGHFSSPLFAGPLWAFGSQNEPKDEPNMSRIWTRFGHYNGRLVVWWFGRLGELARVKSLIYQSTILPNNHSTPPPFCRCPQNGHFSNLRPIIHAAPDAASPARAMVTAAGKYAHQGRLVLVSCTARSL